MGRRASEVVECHVVMFGDAAYGDDQTNGQARTFRRKEMLAPYFLNSTLSGWRISKSGHLSQRPGADVGSGTRIAQTDFFTSSTIA